MREREIAETERFRLLLKQRGRIRGEGVEKDREFLLGILAEKLRRLGRFRARRSS